MNSKVCLGPGNAVKFVFKTFTLKPEVCSSRETFLSQKWTNQVLLSLGYHVQIKLNAFNHFSMCVW